MKKVFLDCGANKGQSVKRFQRAEEYTKDFLMYSFEPVPFLVKQFKNKVHDVNVTLIEKAVWIYDGDIDFYFNKPCRKPEGSTLIASRRKRRIEKKPHTVECMDFSKWLSDNFNKTDYIVLKMDIEGAEYSVLEKMMEDETISYINKAYIEFHYNVKKKIETDRHQQLIDRLKNVSGLELLPEMSKVIA